MRHGGTDPDHAYQVGVLYMVLIRDHLLVKGVGQEDCWQPPTKDTPMSTIKIWVRRHTRHSKIVVYRNFTIEAKAYIAPAERKRMTKGPLLT